MATRKRTRKRQKPVTEIRKPRAVGGTAKVLSPGSVKAITREWQILEMRRDGWTLQQIGAELNIDPKTVRDHLVRVLQRTITDSAESAEENRQLQIERLDALLKRYMEMAAGGNFAAASLCLSIEARRSKLLALDMPETKKLDVTGIREYVGVDVSQV